MGLGQEWPLLVEKKSLQGEGKKEEKNSLHKKLHSLKKRIDFLFVRKSGKSIKGKYFIINYLKSNKPEIKLGITVSKKIGNSVTRNYIKRIIRSINRNNLNEVPENLNFEIIPKKKIETKKFFDLEKDFLNLMKNLEI